MTPRPSLLKFSTCLERYYCFDAAGNPANEFTKLSVNKRNVAYKICKRQSMLSGVFRERFNDPDLHDLERRINNNPKWAIVLEEFKGVHNSHTEALLATLKHIKSTNPYFKEKQKRI